MDKGVTQYTKSIVLNAQHSKHILGILKEQ